MSLSPYGKLDLISVQKIWDTDSHAALTDLIFFQGAWLCTFRESDAHVLGADGEIRIIESQDGNQWNSVASFQSQGIDLRDPKLSITPEGRLMLLVGASIYRDEELISRQPMVTFSNDGKSWEPFYENSRT